MRLTEATPSSAAFVEHAQRQMERRHVGMSAALSIGACQCEHYSGALSEGVSQGVDHTFNPYCVAI